MPSGEFQRWGSGPATLRLIEEEQNTYDTTVNALLHIDERREALQLATLSHRDIRSKRSPGSEREP